MRNGRAGSAGNRPGCSCCLPWPSLLAGSAGCTVRAPTVAAPTPSAPASLHLARRSTLPHPPRSARDPRVRAPDIAGPLSRVVKPEPGGERCRFAARRCLTPGRLGARSRPRSPSTSLGISLPIRPVGVDEDGTMELPGTVSRAGWYEFGARPADPDGTTVLAAHVDTRAEGLGPFARLREAREGSTVAVTDRRGDALPIPRACR